MKHSLRNKEELLNRFSFLHPDLKKIYGEDTLEIIYTMFFGPYLEEWRDLKTGIFDNSDESISNRLDIKLSNVTFITTSMADLHFELFVKKEEYYSSSI